MIEAAKTILRGISSDLGGISGEGLFSGPVVGTLLIGLIVLITVFSANR